MPRPPRLPGVACVCVCVRGAGCRHMMDVEIHGSGVVHGRPSSMSRFLEGPGGRALKASLPEIDVRYNINAIFERCGMENLTKHVALRRLVLCQSAQDHHIQPYTLYDVNRWMRKSDTYLCSMEHMHTSDMSHNAGAYVHQRPCKFADVHVTCMRWWSQQIGLFLTHGMPYSHERMASLATHDWCLCPGGCGRPYRVREKATGVLVENYDKCPSACPMRRLGPAEEVIYVDRRAPMTHTLPVPPYAAPSQKKRKPTHHHPSTHKSKRALMAAIDKLDRGLGRRAERIGVQRRSIIKEWQYRVNPEIRRFQDRM